jgi:hypothetical protein
MLPEWLTAEQKADIKQSLRDTELRRQGMYFKRFDQERYGSPEPDPVAPKTLMYNYADSKEVRASINHIEGEVNGLKKMAHTHSKKEDKY